MLNVSKKVSDLLLPESSVSQCKLVLSETGESAISFEVRYKYITNPDKPQKIQKIGCKFINLSRSAEDVIIKYMNQIQREDLQKNISLH
jgi:hypothetical protein